MKQNHKPFAPEAATDEPASPATPAIPAPAADEAEERDPLGHPAFATEEEDSAYWRGLTAGLRINEPAQPGPMPGDPPFETRRQRRARHDGFTGPKRAVFLEGLADGMTIAAAAATAGISPTAVYNLRNRREGRAFDIGCEAATRRGRKVLADRYRDRAIEGQVTTRYDQDGNVLGTRHHHDNRLAMAVLTRLDAKAAAYRDDERLVTAVSEEFEELLDCIEEGGDAEAFVEARRPPSVELDGARRESDASIMARYKRLHRFDDVDPEDIDISDLDPAKIEDWTDDQWDRAEASGFLDTLPYEEEEDVDQGETEEADGAEPDEDSEDKSRHSREGGNPDSVGEEEQH